MRLLMIPLLALLSGCATYDMASGAVTARAAGVMTRAVDAAQWQICTAISARELIERYGTPGRWEAWLQICGYSTSIEAPTPP